MLPGLLALIRAAAELAEAEVTGGDEGRAFQAVVQVDRPAIGHLAPLGVEESGSLQEMVSSGRGELTWVARRPSARGTATYFDWIESSRIVTTLSPTVGLLAIASEGSTHPTVARYFLHPTVLMESDP